MALSDAERARRCREKKIKAGLSDVIRDKDRQRKQKCLEHVLTHLKALKPSLKQLIIFSDGSASQFKQRFLFKNLTFIAKKFSISLSWNFFASSHGKGNTTASF